MPSPIDYASLRTDFQKDITEGMETYASLERRYHVNRGVIWKIVNVEDYEPSGADIRARLGLSFTIGLNVLPDASVPTGAIIGVSASRCPKCGRHFISNAGNRIYCFICSPYRGHKR